MTRARVAGMVAALAACAACSSGKTRPAIEDGKSAKADGAMAPDAPAAATPPSTAKTGDVQIRVEWRDVPVAPRASPGNTPCKTPRAPAVAPTTTWGIPDALVIVEGAPPIANAAARMMLVDCALAPRIAIGTSLEVVSGVLRPSTIAVARRGQLATLPQLDPGTPLRVQLPIAGHAVAPAIEAGALYEVAADASDATASGAKTTETAWFVASAHAAVTDATGVVLVKDVSVGKHAASAWLPPRGGQPARHAKGEVTVEPGDLAELVLVLE